MSELTGFGLPTPQTHRENQRVTHVMIQHPLHRVLNFTGRTIDDVVNDPIAKNQVLGFYKLHKFVQRGCEIIELERQWNSIA